MFNKSIDEILARLSALENAVGIGGPAYDDEDDAPPPAGDVRLSKSQTARRYAVSPRTIERHVADPTLGFPQPDIVHGRWWFWLSKLQAYDHRRARIPFKSVRPPQLTRNKKARVAE